MTDVEPQQTSLEDIGAGLLNGAMVTLLGCAVAGVLAWQIIAQLTGWLPDLQAMTADLPPVDFKTLTAHERGKVIGDSVFGGFLILLTLGFVGRGVRHLRKHLALLRACRR
jgi:hypothetical protein